MIFDIVVKHKVLFLAIILTTFLFVPIGFYQPIMLKKMVDSLVQRSPAIKANLIIYFVLCIVGLLITACNEIATFNFHENVAYNVEKNLFKKILYASYNKIKKFDKNELMGRAFYDNYLVKDVLYSYLRLLHESINFLLYTSLLIFFLGKIALILPIIFIPFGLLYIRFSEIAAKLDVKVRNRFENAFIILSSFISGIKYISAHRTQSFFEKKVNKTVDDLKEGFIEIDKKALISRLSFSIMEMIVFFFLLVLSVSLYRNGKLTIGTLTAVISFIKIYVTSVKIIFSTMYKLKSNRGLYQKVNDVWTLIPEEHQGIKLKTKLELITFQNVKFFYNENIILNIDDLKLERKKYAIVGRTGSGKTTMVNLLFRLMPVKEGSIKFNETNVSFLDPSWFRDYGLYVFQENILFNLSLQENIMININEENDKTSEKLKSLLEKLGLSDFLDKKEHRLDDLISDCGDNFSGGEKKFISILRSILSERKPQLIVFDEPYENLDQKWRKVVKSLIEQFADDTMTFVISHSYNDLNWFDEVLFLSKGKLMKNTHKKMMENSDYVELIENKR